MTVRQVVDRTLEEMLRLKAVEKGYLADRTQFTDKASYDQANRVIVEDKKFFIEVHGVGSVHGRGVVDKVAFYINRGNDEIEPHNGYPATVYKEVLDEQGNKIGYDKYLKAKKVHACEYEIRYVANTPEADRVCEEIFYETFSGAFFQLLTDERKLEGEYVHFEQTYAEPIENTDIKEMLYRMFLHDIMLEKDRKLNLKIAPITAVDGIIEAKHCK